MKALNRISLTFLKNSRRLTTACFLSTFIASFLLVLMYNLKINAEKDFAQKIRDTMGDCDIIATLPENTSFSQERIQEIQNIPGIHSIESGRWGYIDIQHNAVYTVGVTDGNSNKARYQYDTTIMDYQVILNEVMANFLQLDIGDTLTIGSHTLEIAEITSDDPFTPQNRFFVIVTQSVLCDLLHVPEASNYLFIKRDKAQRLQDIADALQQYDSDMEVTLVEDVAQYREQIESYRIFLSILGVIVVCICGLLIAGVFRSFLQKYLPDIMVLRTIGGKNRQVAVIFLLLGFWITGTACLSAFFVTMTAGKLLFKVFAHHYHLGIEATDIHIAASAVIILTIFVLIMLFLAGSILLFVRHLPLQSMRQKNRFDITYTGRSLLSRGISWVLRGDTLISYKLAIPKIRENVLLLFTILFLTIFSYAGNDVINLLQTNNREYYRSLYLDELMIENGDDLPMKWKDARDIYQYLEEHADGIVFPVFELYETAHNSYLIGDAVTDFQKLYQRKIISVPAEDYHNAIILSDQSAKEIGWQTGKEYKLGDLYEDPNIEQSALLAGTRDYLWHGTTLFDIHNPEFQPQDNDLVVMALFSNTDSRQINSILEELRITYPDLHWQSYTALMKWAKQRLTEWFAMLQLVLYILTILAGIGWYNSAKNMITSRISEYRILRQLGMSEKRVSKIIWRQLLLYLLLGLGLGIVLGVYLMALLRYRETEWETWDPQFHIYNIWFLLIFFVVLMLSLKPVVKRASQIHFDKDS
ncbi:MAG: FtsX-like permease family protein [Lachnospiraceae bacterium]|nr:FtsX-like permease family protein [Lachnospiraceae bacterium]